MYINLCPGAIALSYSNHFELIDDAKKHGFGGVDFLTHLIDSDEQLEKVIKAKEDAGLKWGLFGMPCDFLAVSDSEFDANLALLNDKILPMAKKAGCLRSYNHIWSGSNDMESADYYKWLIKRINAIVETCAKFDVLYGLEFLGAKTLMESFKHPFNRKLNKHLELLLKIDNQNNVGLILDTFHFHTSGATIEDLKLIPADMQIVNVHTNDAPSGVAIDDHEDMNRRLPAETGVIPLDAIMAFLKARGYDGPVICEPFNPACKRFSGMDKADVLDEVSGILQKAVN